MALSNSRGLILREVCQAVRRGGARVPSCSAHTWWKFQRWQDTVKDKEQFDREEEMQKIYFRGSSGMYISAEKPEDVVPQKPPEEQTRDDRGMMAFDSLANHTMMRYIDFSKEAINKYSRMKQLVELQYDQRFLAERHLFLGADLAAAHFVVHRDGAVKFIDDDLWYKKNEKEEYSLPGTRIPGLYLEAIDLSNTNILFEGLENIIDLKKLRYLSFANCHYVNDWCISRLYQYERSLEYLDLSHCKRLSANAISSLAGLKKLRYLKLDGLSHVKNLAKAALLLEEKIPGLEVFGVDYDGAMESLDQELRLQSHERIVEDARGNYFVEDKHGQSFYVGGKMTERVVVDTESDFPLIMSKIRPDPPDIPLAELEEIEKLSQGRLRHYLVGSPSGYSWSQESEILLSMEAKKKADAGEETHPFMLPDKDKSRLKELESGKDGNETKVLPEATV